MASRGGEGTEVEEHTEARKDAGIGMLGKHPFLLRDLFVLCALSALLFSLIAELRRPCAIVGRCESRLCSFLWR